MFKLLEASKPSTRLMKPSAARHVQGRLPPAVQDLQIRFPLHQEPTHLLCGVVAPSPFGGKGEFMRLVEGGETGVSFDPGFGDGSIR